MVTDPIADLLTRIRNASRARHATLACPASRQKERILALMVEEGYIESFERSEEEKGKPELKVRMKYLPDGSPVMKEISRLSSPGKRVYVGKDNIPRFKGGLGTVVVSTSTGLLTDRDARRQGVGGELVCSIF